MTARRTTRPQVVTIYWRDIPAQVNGQAGRARHQVLLSAKFQRAIDRAKRKAGIVTAADDVAQWRRESVDCTADLAAAANLAAADLEARYSRELLGRLALAGGLMDAIGPDEHEQPEVDTFAQRPGSHREQQDEQQDGHR